MAGRKRELKDEAADLLRKGKYTKALELYQTVIGEDPTDFSVRRNLGYIFRKLGRLDEAIRVFIDLANDYASDGFLLKAIATCKVVLEIDPHHTETQQRLAELYSNRTPTKAPELKVMADLATEAIELPVSKPGPDFEVQRTTPPAQVYGMVDLTDAGAIEAPAATPILESLPEMELIELEPIQLKPLEPTEPAPAETVQGELIEPPPPDPEPVESTAQSEIALPDAPMPEIDIDLEFELDETPAKQSAESPEIPLFCDLEPEAFVTLLEQMKLVRMRAGQWILREGDSGSSMFTIASGKVRVLKRIAARKLVQLAILGEGAFFGEMSLLRGGIRGASVQAVESGELFEVSRELIDSVARQYPAVEGVLRKFAQQRLLRNVMITSALFRPFGKQERIEIIEQFVSREVEADEVLVSEGVESDGLYVVLRGQMEVFCKTADEQTILVGGLGEGEVFGEISCLRKAPAIATVKAKAPGSILRLPRTEFDKLVMSHPQILELVSVISDERLAETSNLLAKKGILI